VLHVYIYFYIFISFVEKEIEKSGGLQSFLIHSLYIFFMIQKRNL